MLKSARKQSSPLPMRVALLVLASAFTAACASVVPPTPPMAITSHAVTAADYPLESVALREHGTTQLQYLVRPGGAVDRIIIARSSGSSRLDQAAKDIVNRWRFEPATTNSKPVPAWLDANVVFVLR